MRGFVFLAVLVAIMADVQGNRRVGGPRTDVCKKFDHIELRCQGTCGGFAGEQCLERYDCIYRPESTLGDCCRKIGQCPPPSDLLGPCVIDPATSCTKDLDCEGRKICCEDSCGKVCMDPVRGPN
ncbi:hypothetical protein ACF0H5_021254 [Mactra antiquata]